MRTVFAQDRDGYFLQIPAAEAERINQADSKWQPDSGSLDAELFGEITATGVRTIMKWMHGRLPTDYVFCDLGSGTGKMAVQVTLQGV